LNGTRKPQGYFEHSRTLTYSALAVLPLLIFYEAGIWLLNWGSPSGIRNAADVALKEPFLLLGPYGRHLLLATLLVAALAIYRYETQPRRIRIIRSYFPLMLGESMVYAAMFGTVINLILRPLFRVPFLAPGMTSLSLPTRFTLSLGAGLYEELMFRVLLVSALFLLLRYAARWQPMHAYAIAAVLGALLFSGYHYVGAMGDPFTLHTFLYRFEAGLILNVLYLSRGFGIAAYTHAFYDLLVTVFLPIG
jgi:hypothetical protein